MEKTSVQAVDFPLQWNLWAVGQFMLPRSLTNYRFIYLIWGTYIIYNFTSHPWTYAKVLIQDFSFVKFEYQLKKCDTYWPTRSDWIWNIFDRIKFKLWNTTGRSWNSRSINWRHRKYWVSIAQSQSLTHKPKNAESALTMYTGYKTGSKPETDIKFILFIPLSEQTCT